jgi:aryl-alcohol dehydrogenase-like predicted oxidoreductase
MENLDRRDFIRKSVAGSMMLGISSGLPGWSNLKDQSVDMQYTILGKTGLKVSRVGLGGWQIGIEDISQDKVNKIVETALESGINYFDTAPNYGQSEDRLGVALKGNREKTVIATKTEEATYDGAWSLLEKSLKRLQTDFLDVVFLHSLGNQERFSDIDLLISKKGALNTLVEARKQGIVKHIGVSGHSFPSLFHRLLDTGEVDVLMNAVNFVSRHVYNFEDKVWARANQMNLGLVAMKVLGGANDQGIRIPKEHYRTCLQYALYGTPAHNAIIGIESPEQVTEMVNTAKELKEMQEEEFRQAYKLGLEMSSKEIWKAPYGGPVT